MSVKLICFFCGKEINERNEHRNRRLKDEVGNGNQTSRIKYNSIKMKAL